MKHIKFIIVFVVSGEGKGNKTVQGNKIDFRSICSGVTIHDEMYNEIVHYEQ